MTAIRPDYIVLTDEGISPETTDADLEVFRHAVEEVTGVPAVWAGKIVTTGGSLDGPCVFRAGSGLYEMLDDADLPDDWWERAWELINDWYERAGVA